MTDLTITEMRKDLFRIVDQLIANGQPLRIRRGAVTLELIPKIVEKSVAEMTPKERYDRWMALGPHPDAIEFTEEDINRDDHWEWSGEVDPK